VTPPYRISAARKADLAWLPEIELAAARLLAEHAPESVLSETSSHEILKVAQREDRVSVALADDVPVGFAHVEVLDADTVHLEEIDVDPDHARRGLGARLVMHVCFELSLRQPDGLVRLTRQHS